MTNYLSVCQVSLCYSSPRIAPAIAESIHGQPWATVSKTVRPMLSDRCLSCPVCPVCDVGVLRPNACSGWIKMPLGIEVRLGPGHIVLDGNSAPQQKRGTAPQFSAHVCCGQTAGQIKMPLGREVGLGPGDTVLDGDPAAPPRKRAQQPPLFGPCLLWPNGRPSQLLLSSSCLISLLSPQFCYISRES